MTQGHADGNLITDDRLGRHQSVIQERPDKPVIRGRPHGGSAARRSYADALQGSTVQPGTAKITNKSTSEAYHSRVHVDSPVDRNVDDGHRKHATFNSGDG